MVKLFCENLEQVTVQDLSRSYVKSFAFFCTPGSRFAPGLRFCAPGFRFCAQVLDFVRQVYKDSWLPSSSLAKQQHVMCSTTRKAARALERMINLGQKYLQEIA